MFLGIAKYYFFNYQEPSFKFSIWFSDSYFASYFYGPLYYNGYYSLYFGYSYAFFASFDCYQPYFMYYESLNRC